MSILLQFYKYFLIFVLYKKYVKCINDFFIILRMKAIYCFPLCSTLYSYVQLYQL